MRILKNWRLGAAAIIATLAVLAIPTALAAQTPATIELGENELLGEILAAGSNGLTLYIFTPDEPGVSNCNGGCATAWPPLTVPDGEVPTLGAGVNGTVSLITRDDGSMQVALDDQPLYFWQNDVNPGDALGQDVNDVWFVLDADGAIVQTPPATIELGGNDVLGEFIVDGITGWTLYIFTPDMPGVSVCNGGCATAWPPLTAADADSLRAGPGISGELSLITRDDGSEQVALDGAPLYFWQNDTKPGDSLGQDVNDVWFVIDANGAIVNTPGGAAPAPAPAAPPVAAAAGNAGISAGGGNSSLMIALLAVTVLGLVLGGRRLVRER